MSSCWISILLLIIATVAAKEGDDTVTCGSAIKLKHRETSYYLNSEGKSLNAGSGQQIVTFVTDKGTHTTLWWLRPANHNEEAEYPENAACQLGQPIRCGSKIRFTHVSTMRNLHSHGVESVLSRQQEVTAYGEGDGKGDGGDDWIVQCKGESWKRSEAVRLFHVDTSRYLGTAATLEFNAQTCGQNCPIMGHLEAFCRTGSDKFGDFVVDQGIHVML